MKNLIIVLLLAFSITADTTSDAFAGKYMKKFETKEGNTFGFVLDIYKEGKFTLQCYRKIVNKNPQEEIVYARGTWTANDNTIIFNSFENDKSGNKKMINISGSKARFNTNSDKAVKTSFKFYETKISWLKGLEVFKLKKY